MVDYTQLNAKILISRLLMRIIILKNKRFLFSMQQKISEK
ncbi:hypothetical protein EIKCOROL_00787 [Eikenella corrodens ATCC 23834]|uniref:Uncharacterized protein n=1 Tax=Eikenella corrodens ATCC 23834 TaxID=546274 RepID=C0DTV7_EIKCO|nr:hypothetical protein EIKCOROL_00787 [Eikenella corrodens ATCC 23834]